MSLKRSLSLRIRHMCGPANRVSNESIVPQRSATPAETSGSRSGVAATDRVESGRWQVSNKRTIVDLPRDMRRGKQR
jgi:hypothetical protein